MTKIIVKCKFDIIFDMLFDIKKYILPVGSVGFPNPQGLELLGSGYNSMVFLIPLFFLNHKESRKNVFVYVTAE